MNTPTRQFEDIQATREQVPLLVGLVSPSGGGKTYSALRLATGIQRITGGDIYGIDTESRRMLHYADSFKFRHIQFGEPFSPMDYLAAIQHCVNKGARTIIIDSMSHEHEGPGGVLELHEQAMGGDFKKQFIAWAKPKAMRRRLINSMLQMNCNFIMCYRAKEKLKIIRGKEPEPRGWQPIAGEEYVYEATLNCLLLPASNGVPCWQPEHDNEGMIKLPAQFRAIFKDGPQLSEDIGVKLAEWSKGGAPPSPRYEVSAEEVSSLISDWKAWPLAPVVKDKATFLEWASGVAESKVAAMRDWTPEIVAACREAMEDQVRVSSAQREAEERELTTKAHEAGVDAAKAAVNNAGEIGNKAIPEPESLQTIEQFRSAVDSAAQDLGVSSADTAKWLKLRLPSEPKKLAALTAKEFGLSWAAFVEQHGGEITA